MPSRAAQHVNDPCASEVARAESFDRAVERVAAAHDFRRHPYLRWAWEASTTRDAFRRTQLPFRFAVGGWSQALAAVLARAPRPELCRGIVRNIADEHGETVDGSHAASFRRYLTALGATDDELGSPCPIAVRAFQQGTTNFCLVRPFEAGAALLGIVEHVYVDISAEIVRLLDERGWVEPGSQDHYDVHEELDVTHARDLLDLARPAWSSPRGRDEVALGLSLGAHLFRRLYLDLLPADAHAAE